MNKLTKIVGVAAILLLIAGAAFFWTFNKPAVVIPVPIATISASPTDSFKYTPEFKAEARSAFIESCKLKVGKQYAAACECGADYLAAHYSDAQLEKAYVEYHTGNTIPSEVQTAYNACKNK